MAVRTYVRTVGATNTALCGSRCVSQIQAVGCISSPGAAAAVAAAEASAAATAAW